MNMVLLITHHIALCTPCIAFLLVSHTCAFTLDPVEQGPEEPVQFKELNPEQEQEEEQGKPRCI
jgi:hypothetical protein